MKETYDVGIIGGGPAGLTAAQTLNRQLLTNVVFDDGSYRNGSAKHMHMVPGWEHKDPAEFRASARSDITNHYSTTTFANVKIVKVAKLNDSLFTLDDASGKTWQVKKLIVASGSADIYPSIKGYEQCWTKRIFHCLFCHGYEDRNATSSGVLAVDGCGVAPMAVHLSENAARLTKAVTVYTNGNDELAGQLKGISDVPPFSIEPRKIQSLHGEPEHITVKFEDGTSKQEAFLVHNPLTCVKGPFVEQLELEVSPMGDIKVEPPMYQTNVRGVFAAGDCITPYKVVPGAISSGCNAAVAAATQLEAELFGHTPMF